jgi:preprotein translocase subunit SecD
MKLFLAFALLSATTAQALPVRIEIGDGVFTPQAEVSFRRNLRTLSTPPYTLEMQAPDIAAFAAFTQERTGQEMRVVVCDEVVFSPDLSAQIENGKIDIHTAMANGRLESFVTQGCP